MLRFLVGLFLFLLSALCLAGETSWKVGRTFTTNPQVKVAVSADGSLVAVGNHSSEGATGNSTASLFDTTGGKLLWEHTLSGEEVINDLNFTPDGNHLLVTSGCQNLTIVKCATGETVNQFVVVGLSRSLKLPMVITLRNVIEQGSRSSSLLNSDPLFVVAGDKAHPGKFPCLRWWDESGRQLREDDLHDVKKVKSKMGRKYSIIVYAGFASSTDKRIWAVSANSFGLLIYRDGQLAETIAVPPSVLPVSACAVNPPGTIVAVSTKSGIRLYTPEGVEKGKLEGGGSLAFSPYGAKLACQCYRRGGSDICILDLATKKPIIVPLEAEDLAWGIDEETLYVAGQDGLHVLGPVTDSATSVSTDPPKAASVEKPTLMEE